MAIASLSRVGLAGWRQPADLSELLMGRVSSDSGGIPMPKNVLPFELARAGAPRPGSGKPSHLFIDLMPN